MKNKLLLPLILLGGILFSSCDNFLTELPSDQLPINEAINSSEDLKNAINGIGYTTVVSRYLYGGDFWAYADLKGENFVTASTVNQISNVGRYAHDQFSIFSEGPYLIGYRMIARANSVLSAVENISASSERDELEGELYALRGLVHFDLARLYAQLPTVAANLDEAQSGIPLATSLIEAEAKPTRATLRETYAAIVSDLTKAMSLMQATATKKTNGRMNYWAAKGLRARAYLYLGQNNEALADAIDVIDNSPYALLERSAYLGSWATEGATETLFEFLATTIYTAQRNSVGYYFSSDGYGEVAATAGFRAFMNSVPNDIRAELIVQETGNYPGYYPKKSPGRDGSLYANNPRIMRLSELYLIAAEAIVKGGTASGAGTAESYINTLRSKRITSYTNVASVTLDDILEERTRELYAEGHAIWDAWRNNKTVNNSTMGVVDNTNDLCLLPIPQREIDISPGLKQNPGY